MDRRLRNTGVAVMAATTLAVGGCADGPDADAPTMDAGDDADAGDADGDTGDAAAGDADEGAGDAAVDGGDAGVGDPAVDGGDAGVRSMEIPSLHPDIDDLDETVVTISTSADTQVQVAAKVAATTAERRRGLMEVPHLPDGTGMLFLFDEERTSGFWMHDTLVPLDVAFVEASGVIGSILAMDPCEERPSSDCPVYTPDVAYRTALEAPQGWFAAQDVDVGDTMTWREPTRPD